VGEAAGPEEHAGGDERTPAGRAARAARHLGHVLAAHDVEPAVLERVADVVGSLADEAAAAGPVRDKWMAIAARRGVLDPADASEPSSWPLPEPPADGEAIEFDAWSFVGGPFNAFAMGARYWRAGDESRGRVTLGPAYEGPPGRVHGGAVAALFDEIMGATLRVLGTRAYTGRLAVDYLRAAPLGVVLDLRGWLVRREGRRLYLAGEGTVEGVAFARAEATFVEMAPPGDRAGTAGGPPRS
jgi:acyl-coenzyme A thioesterase PaaI-like protein